MSKVSIVVPIYQIEEKILDHSLDSLLNQTLDDIEIILVDDGSRDDTLVRLLRYRAEHYDKIVLLSKHNGGISDAHNMGVRLVRSPYVAFVCGDDWISPDYCEKMYNAAVENDADVVISASANVNSIIPSNYAKIFPQKNVLINKYELIKTSRATMGDKLFSIKLFDMAGKDIFPSGTIYEDSYVTPVILSYAEKFCIVDAVTHFHLECSVGTSANLRRTLFPKVLDTITIAGMLIEFAWSQVAKDGDDRKFKAILYRAVSCLESGGQFILTYSIKGEELKNLQRYLDNVSIMLPRWSSMEKELVSSCPSRKQSLIRAISSVCSTDFYNFFNTK
ncbi:MAG: glycosyltransferase family 2 protein [Methanomassiliicoccales archaeon]